MGRRLDVYSELDSSNRVAADLAQSGAPDGSLVVADSQSAGRGRLGRSFFSPSGSGLYLSLVQRPGSRDAWPAAHAPRHVFAASLAVARTARSLLPGRVRVEIKWPNDVLLDGRKTSGINSVADLSAGSIHWIVLGIGVNVNLDRETLPRELREIATSFRLAAGQPFDRLTVAHRLLAELEAQLERLRSEAFHAVLEGWRDFFTMTGERVRVGGPGVDRELDGRVIGIDRDGALLLETGAGRARVVAGDVTLLERG
ncbi:MAG: biotin--[acetyl-CoA-carboxylase] ligase [Myxococcota bacterium]